MRSLEPARPVVPRWILVVLGVAVTGYVIYLLRGVLTPLLLAALIAYLLDPVVDRLEKWRIPRGVAIFGLLGAFLLLITLVLLLVVPMAVRQATEFFQRLPALVDQTWQRLEPWLLAQGIEVPYSLKDLNAQLGSNAGAVSEKAATAIGNVARWVAGSTAGVISALVNAIVVPVLAFYLLYDWDRIRMTARELIPHRWRPLVLDIAGEIDAVVAQFIRGQLVVMAMLAVAYSTAYSAVGVPLAIPIGMLAGLVSFIPHVGGAVALGTALLACALTGPTWLQLVLVVVVHLSIQTLEGFVITPRIMSDQVGLPAAWVILALLGFGELFGLLGVIVAVPVAAAIKTLIVRLVTAYKKSHLFGAPATDSTDVAAVTAVLGPQNAPPSARSRAPSADPVKPRADAADTPNADPAVPAVSVQVSAPSDGSKELTAAEAAPSSETDKPVR